MQWEDLAMENAQNAIDLAKSAAVDAQANEQAEAEQSTDTPVMKGKKRARPEPEPGDFVQGSSSGSGSTVRRSSTLLSLVLMILSHSYEQLHNSGAQPSF